MHAAVQRANEIANGNFMQRLYERLRVDYLICPT